jgi:cardiolipin synthase
MLWLLAVLVLVPVLGQIREWVAGHDHGAQLEPQLAAATPPVPVDGSPAVCLGGAEFMAALGADLRQARQRALVQTLSFEGDLAGQTLVDALLACPAAERRLIIDAYSLHVQSDKLVGSPVRLLDVGLYRERARMLDLVEQLRRGGVEVLFGRPWGLGCDNLQARDHKKMCVVDGVAYVGGINFSDHNFVWRDLMVRLEDERLSGALAADFAETWQGRSVESHTSCGDVQLDVGPGAGNDAMLRAMAAAIDRAEHNIFVECPYITEPLFTMLGGARRRGVQVTVVTSEHINRFGMKWSIMQGCADHDIQLRFWPEQMTHIKALLVDERELVLGSANFDFLSGELQPELLITARDSMLVDDFNARVRDPALAGTWDWSARGENPRLGGLGQGLMSAAAGIMDRLHRRD